MAAALHPLLYQVNTRVWLTELSRQLQRPATLDDLPDEALDRIAARGFDWVWLLSVWQTGAAGQHLSRTRPEWRREFAETLEDLSDADIPGSGFAITGYDVHAALGGDAALARLRERLATRGLRLLLDFVPNHTGIDHPWVQEHPEYYIHGGEDDLARAPQNFTRVAAANGEMILGHGRDPYFDGWPDTLQLDYCQPALQAAMTAQLLKIAAQCDGVRCDMAMLALPEIFERTWGRPAPAFWARAIASVRDRAPGFCFMAEVYWDLEWRLQQEGFDYTYDKRLYDRLRAGQARLVREHLQGDADYQRKMARFLENHDEPRAAATFPPPMHEAAAIITFLAPGLRFFHEGQLEGRRKRISPHLCRAPVEPADATIAAFYEALLEILHRPILRCGDWQLLQSTAAWDGNGSWDSFVAFAWTGQAPQRLVVAVNYSATAAQCYLQLPFPELTGNRWLLADVLGDARYERDGADLATRGLYLDVPPWQCHVFELLRADA
ncbi:MAG: alpha-amylase family glycosyl hydrolase [Verrucomicrobiota bacterium]|nr:alpha-amylase family glycosyl hydrolase [Verrucomicrobiota bacterium]